LVSSCSAQPNTAWKELKNPEAIAIIDDYPLSHEEISRADIKTINTPFGMQAIGYCGVFLAYELDYEEFEIRISRISQSHEKVNSSLKTRKLPGEEDVCDFDTVIPEANHPYLISVEEFSMEKPEYFLFRAEEGRFANDEFLNYESSCTDQKHGYSSGAVIDRASHRIMHWMMVW